jgi:uncharacterized protein YuzE
MEQELKFLYDQEADVLYVSQGRPEYTDYVEAGDDLILRLDPQTREVVGFTILDFVAHFSRREPGLRIPLDVVFRPRAEVKTLLAA